MKPKYIIFTILLLLISATLYYFYFVKNSYIINNADTAMDTSQLSNKTIKFNGEVASGGNFEKKIGDNLYFRLEPTGFGWTISIVSNSKGTSTENASYENFVGVVTPPYHGIRDINIDGWQFRNSDNSAPNRYVTNNNIKGVTREFYFVLNDKDYNIASGALDKMLYSYSYPEQEVNEATSIHDNLSTGQGTLTINNLKLNTLTTREQANIESMQFSVELNLP